MRPSAEKAGSYRPIPMPTPMTIQPTTNTGSDGASPSVRRPPARSSALPESTGRPPWRSIRWPTRGDTSPEISRPIDRAPTTQPAGQPVSATIGPARTAVR
jgi:hypothetical protein